MPAAATTALPPRHMTSGPRIAFSPRSPSFFVMRQQGCLTAFNPARPDEARFTGLCRGVSLAEVQGEAHEQLPGRMAEEKVRVEADPGVEYGATHRARDDEQRRKPQAEGLWRDDGDRGAAEERGTRTRDQERRERAKRGGSTHHETNREVVDRSARPGQRNATQ